jgi:iron-siderophore transport system substrate-binding protein
MTRSTHPLRYALLAGAAATLALAGCGSSGGSASTTSSSSAASSTAATAGGSFPVTISSALGDATIPADPQRVVTISWQNQDVALALGVVPVAIPAATYGGDDTLLYPWFHEKLADQPVPTLMDETSGLQFEAISAAKPDVILAAYSGITQQDFDTLTKIAPTVAYPEAPYATDWKDTTTIIGKALGKESEAQQLITDTEDYITSKGEEFPQLAGKTFAYAAYPNDTELNVYTPTDARVQLLTGLGLVVAPSVETLSQGATSFFVPVSFETLDTVTSDILILIADDEAQKAELLANPFIANLPQVQSGAYAILVGQQFVMSTSAPSVLSIPWGFDQFVPELAAAADKVA